MAPPLRVRVQFVTGNSVKTKTLDPEAALKVTNVLAEHWGLAQEPHAWGIVEQVQDWGRPASLCICRGCGARAVLPDSYRFFGEDRVYVALAGVPQECPLTEDKRLLDPPSPAQAPRSTRLCDDP